MLKFDLTRTLATVTKSNNNLQTLMPSFTSLKTTLPLSVVHLHGEKHTSSQMRVQNPSCFAIDLKATKCKK